MSKLITKFDVEAVILRKKFNGEWPGAVLEVTVYYDELEIRVRDENDKNEVANALCEWFPGAYDGEAGRINLESPQGRPPRWLEVIFEIDSAGERLMPRNLKPGFAEFSLYPESPSPALGLRGPDPSKLKDPPHIWTFYSFKGGVSRTLHLISLVKALSEQKTGQKLLIVDGDLEAPGLTWWGKEQGGEPHISYLDFLTLAHYDRSEGYADAIKTTAAFMERQTLRFDLSNGGGGEHFFLPAFRGTDEMMRMPLRPEHVCRQSGKEWLIPELLHLLGKELGVYAVVVDLRAGLSEISSPLLLDPRVNRVIVTTPSSQSVEGTEVVLRQIRKISGTFDDRSGYETQLPTIMLAMVKEDIKDTQEITDIKTRLEELVLPTGDDAPEKELLHVSWFDEKLLLLKNLESTLEKLDRTNLHQQMSRIVAEWFYEEPGPPGAVAMKAYKENLGKLEKTAKEYVYAEFGEAEDFLITENLKNIAREFETEVPAAVIMGVKGAGKTFTYLQLARLKTWSAFVQQVGEKFDGDHGFILPLISPRNLKKPAREIIDRCRETARKEGGIYENFFEDPQNPGIGDLIDKQKSEGGSDAGSWKQFWFGLMAGALSCKTEGIDHHEAVRRFLEKKGKQVVFLIDGLEDYFQDTGKEQEEIRQVALRTLCQDVPEGIRDRRGDKRAGLLVFIRKDLAKASIKQNFGQFEALYEKIQLEWGWDEAKVLAAWLAAKALGEDYFKSAQTIEEKLQMLWGLKLGSDRSKEAYTTRWVLAALSDFKRRLQARDLVRLIHYAAKYAREKFKDNPPDGRILPPLAIKDALDPCSEEKIDEIGVEIETLNDIFNKLKKLGKKQIPFDKDDVQLTADEIDYMKKVNVVTETEEGFYMPEIIRRGLGFSLATRGRLKVLALLERASNS